MTKDLECSTFQDRPAYRYIRKSDALPLTEAARAEADPLVRVKLFDPTSAGTWYLAGYDPETRIAWGAAYIFEHEIGDIYIPELIALRDQFGLPIERDLHFAPCRLSECKGR